MSVGGMLGCPFCGGWPSIVSHLGADNTVWFKVVCVDCNCQTTQMQPRTAVIDCWNTRKENKEGRHAGLIEAAEIVQKHVLENVFADTVSTIKAIRAAAEKIKP